MTSTSFNPQQATNLPTAFAPIRQMVEGQWLQLTAGLMGQAFNRMFGGPLAQPCLPPAADVRCGTLAGGCIPEPRASWTASMTGQGTAAIDLGDGYKLRIDERSSEMTIFNERTGETTRIWGDPHVDVDGKRAFDFWGTSTFVLENGTKVTINTEQWAGNPNMYVASQVTITKGSNAIIVNGISQNQLGDLSITQSNNGYAVDAATRDGFTVHENACGSGWRTEAGGVATQREADATRIGAEYGPGSQAPSFGELAETLGSFLLFGAVLNMTLPLFAGVEGGGQVGRQHRHLHHPALFPLR